MKLVNKALSAMLLTGLLIGCTPAAGTTDAATTSGAASVAGTTTAGTTSAGTTTAATVPVVTLAIDRDIILAEGEGLNITSGQLEDEFEKMLDNLRGQYGAEMVDGALGTLQNEKANILDQLVRNELLNLRADEMGILLESDDAKAKFDEIMTTNLTNYGGQEQFDKILTNAGYTAQTYRAEVLKALRFETVAEEVTKDVAVTDAEITTAYEEAKATSYTQPAGATIYHIFFGKPEEAEAEAKAKEAKQKLNDGADFGELAAEYGKDGTATQGGLLGNYPYQNQELSPDFMAEAQKLAEGEISEPVKTSFGWHLIMVEDVVKEAVVLGLNDPFTKKDGTKGTVRDNVQENLLNLKKTERLTALLNEWETKYKVVTYADRIPMNVKVEDPAVTTPGSTTTPATTAK